MPITSRVSTWDEAPNMWFYEGDTKSSVTQSGSFKGEELASSWQRWTPEPAISILFLEERNSRSKLSEALPALAERDLLRRSWSKFSETLSLSAELDLLMRELQEIRVRLLRQKEIREYLLSFPDLIDITRKAVYAAREHIPEAQLIMEVYHDPEIEDRYLLINARFQDYDDSVIDKIKAAESEYIDLLSNTEGWIQLSTDFQEPEPA